MKAAVTTGSRSSNGCWTCRVRKKKCDEHKPSCFPCISFGLECHGYGERPKWMDNGELQKQQATKIKQTVSRTSRSKKRKWTENSRALSLECESSQEYSFSTAMDGLLEGEGDNDSTKHSISSGMRSLDTTPLDEQMWGSIFNNDYFRSQLSNGFSGYIDTSATSKSVDYEHPFLSQDSTRSILRSPSDLANIREKEVIWGDAKIQNDLPTLEGATWSSVTNKEAFLMSHTEPEAGYSARLLPLPNTSLTDNNSIKPKMSLQGLNGWAARGEIEDTLFMHYLDQVFYVQYPFYDAIDKQNRGWLLSFLKGVKSAYHATLALSELHLLSTHFQNSDTIPSYTKLRCQDSYYDQACREMERCVDSSGWWDESTRLVRSIECLACILQLLFFELFTGGTGDWQKYLSTAAGLLPALVQHSITPVSRQSTVSSIDITVSKDIQKSSGTKQNQAIHFLLGSFIALEAIFCASTRSKPLFDIDHKLLLRALDIDSGCYIGCDNDIMVLIFEISELDDWKKQASESQKLSIVELANRGSRIEKRLYQKLGEIENSSASAGHNINQICALSAIVYLHVVISGAHPELPEIKEGVTEALAAFQSLTDKKLLVNAVWAFCISGCMAVEDQQDAFRELFAAAKVTHSTIGTLAEAFKIIETCWEMRITGSYSCDWLSAMDKLGRHFLLR